VDNVIIAIGQRADAEQIAASAEGLETDQWGGIAADLKTARTGNPYVFAGGDLVSGAATVVEAIEAGQKGARAIDQTFFPEPEKTYLWEKLDLPDAEVDVEREVEEEPPVSMPLLPAEDRFISVEVERTINDEQARNEARRCLRCDYKD